MQTIVALFLCKISFSTSSSFMIFPSQDRQREDAFTKASFLPINSIFFLSSLKVCLKLKLRQNETTSIVSSFITSLTLFVCKSSAHSLQSSSNGSSIVVTFSLVTCLGSYQTFNSKNYSLEKVDVQSPSTKKREADCRYSRFTPSEP